MRTKTRRVIRTMSDDLIDQLSEQEKEDLLNSPLVKKGVAFKKIGEGLEHLEDNEDHVFNSIVRNIEQRSSRVNSEDTVEEILDLLIDEVRKDVELMEDDDEDDGGDFM